MTQHIIRNGQGHAGLLHTNACGRHCTWTTDDQSTRFPDVATALARAERHGLRPHEFHVEPAPDIGEAATHHTHAA